MALVHRTLQRCAATHWARSPALRSRTPRGLAASSRDDDEGRRTLASLWSEPGLLKFAFSRSSGPGGQNVNKVNSKAELRLNVGRAVDVSALGADVAERLTAANTVTAEGVLAVSSQAHRTQKGNRLDCEAKLAALLANALEPPKVRAQRTGISKATKAKRTKHKRQRRDVKANRGRVSDW